MHLQGDARVPQRSEDICGGWFSLPTMGTRTVSDGQTWWQTPLPHWLLCASQCYSASSRGESRDFVPLWSAVTGYFQAFSLLLS